MRGLSGFSIGLGQVAAPGALGRLIGVGGDSRTRTVLRVIGLRELAAGLGILSGRWRTGWVWARVGGDAMDLALLGKALTSDDTEKGRVAASLAAVVGVTVADATCGVFLARGAGDHTASGKRGIEVKQSVTILRPADEIYRQWRDFTNLPRLMRHLEAVQVTGELRSHWTAQAPAGTSVEWDAEITEDRPNEYIAWRSLPDAPVPNSGSVRFVAAPGGRGTEIHVELRYDPPAGKLGALVAKLFGEEPKQQVQDDLRRFKQIMETGEVTQSDASIQSKGLIQRPAQPPTDERIGKARAEAAPVA